MDTHPKELPVVIAEAALERPLVRDVKRLGAHGYTVIDVRGGAGAATAALTGTPIAASRLS